MANKLSANVYRIDASGSIDGNARRIHSIRYIGSSAGAIVITKNDVNGVDSTEKVWENSGSSNVFDSNIDMSNPSGWTITVTSAAVAYLYLGNR